MDTRSGRSDNEVIASAISYLMEPVRLVPFLTTRLGQLSYPTAAVWAVDLQYLHSIYPSDCHRWRILFCTIRACWISSIIFCCVYQLPIRS